MGNNKTVETGKSVDAFLKTVKTEAQRKDCVELISIVSKITKQEPKMWGPSIIGFGSHHYVYDSGREGDSPNMAFSPRASSIALYLSANLEDREALLKKLGKHKTDKGCIHIKTLADVDRTVLSKMISNHLKHVSGLYGA